MVRFMNALIEEIFGKKVKTIDVYVSWMMGTVPTLHLSAIIFDDNTKVYIEGEHDNAYLPLDQESMDVKKILEICENDDLRQAVIDELQFTGNST
jgi:hypothetical protein